MTNIRIEGDKELVRKLGKASAEVKSAMQPASRESVEEVLGTEGVAKYPSETSANNPPVPFYIRGRGTETAGGNLGNSERYGSSWNVTSQRFGAVGTNTASYSPFLGDDDLQARAMGRIGWKKLGDAAKEKSRQIGVIFNKWIARAIRKAGL